MQNNLLRMARVYFSRRAGETSRGSGVSPRVPFRAISWIGDGVTAPRTPFIIQPPLASPIHRTLSLSHSHKLWAWRAISAAQIWDACNYCTIYSNQPDPNLYFPEAPARLRASSYLPGRHSPRLCFLIRPPLQLLQQRGKKTSPAVPPAL